MTPFAWTLHDADGTPLRTTQTFDSREEAEAWMGTSWAELVTEGAESVSLMEGDETVYEMGLRPE